MEATNFWYMKKIMVFMVAFSLCTTVSFAQKKKMNHMMSDSMSMKKDCVMMEDGKMMVMKDGKSMMMDQDMTMKNGAMVMKDGSVKMKDGKTMMMKDGDCMYMDGKMSKMKMKKPMMDKKM